MSSVQSQTTNSLSIVNLPSEILRRIFGYVRGQLPSEKHIRWEVIVRSGSSLKDIKNTRLVCWRFHNESSHLLLTTVSVSMSPTSLARLDEISRHPLISQFIQTTQLVPHFFASELAESFPDFLVDRIQQLRVMVISGRSRVRADADSAAMTKSNRILDSWERLLRGVATHSLNDEDLRNMRLIKRAHDQYRQAYLEQERMRTDGTFVSAVADAVARMPRAKSLHITDCESFFKERRVRLVDLMENDDLLVRNLARPTKWGEGPVEEYEIPQVKLLSEIPLAIGRAGVRLTAVRYDIAPTADCSRLLESDRDIFDLKEAMRQLTSFTFEPNNFRFLEFRVSDKNARYLVKFVGVFIDTDSIQNMRINTGFMCPDEEWDEESSSSAGSLLLTRTWPQLRRVDFQGPIHIEELQLFYVGIQTRVKVILNKVYLLSGLWADVLDIMHDVRLEKGGWSSVWHPLGAECDGMAEDGKEEIFDDPYDNLSDYYIMGEMDDNPFRRVRGEDAYNDETGEW
ncbi:hypothetical protein F5Y13DRAFT_191971 [Hypoxylon sp. FL1857]|nr:hypothetical protein F5Y13DRAFT_191971 [Hypoxylon sp. FL1857]